MKPTLPLSLLAALLTCVNVSFATETTTPETDTPSTTPTEYQAEQIVSGEIPIATDPVTGSAENDYTVKIIGENGQSWHVNAKDVTWDTSYNFQSGRPINIGSALTESKVSIITLEGTAEKDYTVVTTGANLFIGCPGWGITGSETYKPKTGEVYVGKNATLIVGKDSGDDTSTSQLNIGAGGSYSTYGHEGILEVDGGTVEAGCLNVAIGYGDVKGTMIVKNGGHAIADARGGNTGVLTLGYYGESTGKVIVESGSTITAEYYTMVGYGRGDNATNASLGAAHGILEVKGNSTANLGSYLFAGRENGSTGVITVDDSTLTAGTTYLGYAQDTSGSLTVSNNSTATLSTTNIGYNGANGTLTVSIGATTTFNSYVIAGGWNGSQGTLNVTEGGTANVNGTLYLGYDSTAFGDSTIAGTGSNLTVKNNTYIGYSGTASMTITDGANADLGAYTALGLNSGSIGTLEISNGASTNINQMEVFGMSSVTINGATAVINNEQYALGVDTNAKLKVEDGASGTGSLTVKGLIDNYGKIEANLTQGGKMEAGSVNNAGTMTLTLGNQGAFTADSLTNTGTVSIDITENGIFTVGEYINNGTSTTITATNGTTCQFGSLDLVSGSMILDGPGAFTLGSADAAVATDFYATNTTTATCINISALGENATFTIDPTSLFTINFTDEALSAIAAGDAGDFELNLVLGYDGFIMDASSLETLLGHTSYNVGDQPATLALTETAEETTGLDKTKYTVSNAQYVIKDNNLVWTGTITNNNAVPEPATASLSLLGLAALLMRRRRA